MSDYECLIRLRYYSHAENEFKNGKVVKRPDKDILNARLKKIYDMYYERCMKIEYANTLTCTQLIKYCIFAESR